MKRKTCLTLALALTLSIPNCVSAASGETVYSVSAEAQATEGKAEAGGEAAQGSEVAELFGKPWIDSVVTGNLPKEAPEAKDDLYLHYNYDELAAHQGEYYLPVLAAMNVIRNSFSEAMEAGKLTDAGDSILTDEELQLARGPVPVYPAEGRPLSETVRGNIQGAAADRWGETGFLLHICGAG